MNKIFAAALCLFSVQILAQTGEYFFTRLPALPGAVCEVDTTSKNEFMRQLGIISREIEEVISTKKKEVRKEADKLKPEMEKKLAQEYGLSSADVQKLKDKNISKEEKKKIADKMMQNKANISMEEIERLKKMSKEGKEAWAEAYGTEVMTNMPSGDSVKTEEQIKMEKELEKNFQLNELVKEQQLLINKIHSVDKMYENKMVEFRKEDSLQTFVLNEELKPLREQLLNYPTKEEQKSIYQLMAQHYITYCSLLSPRYINIIKDVKNSIQPLLPDYNRLEELNSEINKILLSTESGLTSPGLMQLGAVQGLASIMAGAYKYTIPIEIISKLSE